MNYLVQAEDRQGNLLACASRLFAFEQFNLRYVPHSLEADQKPLRVELSRELLQIFKQDQQHEFEQILTGDENWFFLSIFIICVGQQIQMRCLKF
jgi:hypothetical protein